MIVYSQMDLEAEGHGFSYLSPLEGRDYPSESLINAQSIKCSQVRKCLSSVKPVSARHTSLTTDLRSEGVSEFIMACLAQDSL